VHRAIWSLRSAKYRAYAATLAAAASIGITLQCETILVSAKSFTLIRVFSPSLPPIQAKAPSGRLPESTSRFKEMEFTKCSRGNTMTTMYCSGDTSHTKLSMARSRLLRGRNASAIHTPAQVATTLPKPSFNNKTHRDCTCVLYQDYHVKCPLGATPHPGKQVLTNSSCTEPRWNSDCTRESSQRKSSSPASDTLRSVNGASATNRKPNAYTCTVSQDSPNPWLPRCFAGCLTA